MFKHTAKPLIYFIADTPFNRHWYPHLIGYGYETIVPYAALEITHVQH